MPLVRFSDGVTVAIDIAVWAVLGTLVGYAAHRMPVTRFGRDSRLTRLRGFEEGGRFYERRLRIRRWKRLLPEAGDLFRGGFSKKRLGGRRLDHLERFAAETRRAEMTHWCLMAAGPAFFLWNPPWLGGVMVTYGILANLPCLVTQRYNRARLERIIARHS